MLLESSPDQAKPRETPILVESASHQPSKQRLPIVAGHAHQSHLSHQYPPACANSECNDVATGHMRSKRILIGFKRVAFNRQRTQALQICRLFAFAIKRDR